jgi:hypothetical protein
MLSPSTHNLLLLLFTCPAHLLCVCAGDASVFTLSTDNAVVQMLAGKGGPRLVTSHLDSKHDLEVQLKSACEAFIMAVTKAAVEPMLSFITKVTAVRVSSNSNPAAAKPLKDQVGAEGGEAWGM